MWMTAMPPPPPSPPSAPSPATPSPHRFLTHARTPKPYPFAKVKQQSQQSSPQTSSHQFAALPKFSFGPGGKKFDQGLRLLPSQVAASSSSPAVSRRLYQHRLTAQKREEIEEAAASDDSDYGRGDTRTLDDHPIQATILDSDDSPSSPPPPHLSKRRRVGRSPPPETDSIILSSPPPGPTNPNPQPLVLLTPPRQIPPQPHSQSQPPRFLPPPTQPPPPSTTTPTPKFLLPSSPSPPPALLPTSLSPPRQAHKYLPGGLASSLRDLVLETSLQVSHQGGWDFRVGVEETTGGDVGQGMVLLREGRREREGEHEGQGRGWVLMGRGADGVNVERGCVVGVRKPVWEVEVLGERWVVGVDWRVLG